VGRTQFSGLIDWETSWLNYEKIILNTPPS